MSDDNVVKFPGETLHDLDARDVLEGVLEDAELDRVVILGWGKNGELWMSSSMAKPSEILLLLEVSKKILLEAMLSGE